MRKNAMRKANRKEIRSMGKHVMRNTLLCAAAVAVLAAGGCARGQGKMSYIGADAAKKQVLTEAGLSESQVTIHSVDMVTRDGMDYYEVYFSDENGNSYRYDVEALAGRIIEGGQETASADSGETAVAAGSETASANGGETASAGGAGEAPGAAAAAGGETAVAAGGETVPAGGAGEVPGAAVATIAAGTTAAGGGSGEMLTVEQAKEKALAGADMAGDSVTFVRADLDWDDGKRVYDVEFYGSDRTEYDVEIDAYSGAVISVDRDMERVRQSGTASAGGGTAGNGTGETKATGTQAAGTGTQPAQQPSAAGNGAKLTAEDAKAKALAHAGLTGAQVTFTKASLDWDDGRQIYEVDFYGSDGTEYDYEISADSGEIVKYDVEAGPHPVPRTQPAQTQPAQTQASGGSAAISAEEAKRLALAQVPGATAADIREFETDRDDGRLEYEGTIYYGGMEYDFEIDAYSGAFRKWESERDD